MTSHVQAYVDHLALGWRKARLFELEHPEYETEEDYRAIMEAWIQGRQAWNPGSTGPICPKPKRRPGRPKEKTQAKKEERLKVTIRLSPTIIGAIAQVQGDLSIEECIAELLKAQLGPLVQPFPSPPEIPST